MDAQLLLALVLGIGTILVLVLRTRLDAFVALLIAALVTGVVAGQSLVDVVDSITAGFGNTLGSIGIVIGLGVAIGKMLEVSGAADALARAFLRAFGKGREEWAMGSIGGVVSIPVFCDSGYVIMNPLARSIARVKQGGYVALALALGVGMTLTHHLVPPTPGPLAVAGLLGADLGLLLVTGLVFAVILLPVVIAYARWVGPQLEEHITPQVREAVYGAVGAGAGRGPGGSGTGVAVQERTGDAADPADPAQELPRPAVAEDAPEGAPEHRVGALLGSLPLLVPLALIVANTVTAAVDRNNQGVLAGDDYTPSDWVTPFAFLGNPVVALVIGLVLAVYLLLPRWTPRRRVHGWLAESAAAAGLILLITGAGGALGQVLRDSGVGDALAEAVGSMALPAFLVPFLIATVVRVAQGSGTVAMITAASVTAPLVASLGVAPLIAALACTAGSMVFSYYNDSYFWVVTRFTGLEGTAALKGWSAITTVAWAGSVPLLLVAELVLG
ncbi:GntP family permease [Ornithinicoccus halotolerans]|uniref:GntP family permease n=1 Tax=Ornithinicoccus halotolerans TaxID=1748220 RepID=UPI001885B502|nr:SLC13 family permease [Ornithinicoccus halotolerans]